MRRRPIAPLTLWPIRTYTEAQDMLPRVRRLYGEVIDYDGDPVNEQGVLCLYWVGWSLLDDIRAAGFCRRLCGLLRLAPVRLSPADAVDNRRDDVRVGAF